MTPYSTSRGLLYTTPPNDENRTEPDPATEPNPATETNRGHATADD